MENNHAAPKSRKEYMRAYQAARRASKSIRPVTIELSAEEFELLQDCVRRQRGPVAGALKRFLLTGAKFVANSGVKAGGKVTSLKPD